VCFHAWRETSIHQRPAEADQDLCSPDGAAHSGNFDGLNLEVLKNLFHNGSNSFWSATLLARIN